MGLFGWRRCGNADILLALLQPHGSYHVNSVSLSCDRDPRNTITYHRCLNKPNYFIDHK